MYLREFHREQAWERWVKDRKHQLCSEDGEILLDLLRNCAWVPSADEWDDIPHDYFFRRQLQH